MHIFLLMILENMGNISRWKESLVERTISRKNTNLMQLVYGKSTSTPTPSIDQEDSSEDEFFKPKGEGNKVRLPDHSFLRCFHMPGNLISCALMHQTTCL